MWDLLIFAFIRAAEARRTQVGWVDPADVLSNQPGLMRDRYYPGDVGFDPLGLKPKTLEELNVILTKELKNRRLAMTAAARFLAQEAIDGKGMIKQLQSS